MQMMTQTEISVYDRPRETESSNTLRSSGPPHVVDAHFPSNIQDKNSSLPRDLRPQAHACCGRTASTEPRGAYIEGGCANRYNCAGWHAGKRARLGQLHGLILPLLECAK